jgi:hypothetical protein
MTTSTSRRRFLAALPVPMAAWLQEPQPCCTAAVHPFGLNYISKHHRYQTSDGMLLRDFQRFRKDGLNLVSFSLYWYCLEGPGQGVYHPDFLNGVRRCIARAQEAGLQVLVTMHTLWGTDSQWCTPAYAVDPVTKTPRGLAVIHSPAVRQAFLKMYEWMVSTLAGTPGIWGYAMLNEPWYFPLTDADRETFIAFIQAQKAIHNRLTPRLPTTIRFVDHRADGPVNHFRRDWNFDQRLLDCLDWVGLNCYPPTGYSWDKAAAFLAGNVAELNRKNKKVFITEFGANPADDAAQSNAYRQMLDTFQRTDGIRGWMPWVWISENWYGDHFDLWSSDRSTTRPAYDVFVANPPWKKRL